MQSSLRYSSGLDAKSQSVANQCTATVACQSLHARLSAQLLHLIVTLARDHIHHMCCNRRFELPPDVNLPLLPVGYAGGAVYHQSCHSSRRRPWPHPQPPRALQASLAALLPPQQVLPPLQPPRTKF